MLELEYEELIAITNDGRMARPAGTDVWYRSYQLRADTRCEYHLADGLQILLGSPDGDTPRLPDRGRRTPHALP